MQNFVYHNPTRLVFGKNTIAELRNLVPAGKVLVTFGGGSIKRNGVYDQVAAALAGHQIVEFGDIQPNPLYEHLMRAVKLVKDQGIAFLLAVGGGSVLDGTKFIAAAARFEGSDPWEILAKGAAVKSAVPLGSVLTLPATGSESNGFSVVSRQSTQEKLAFGSEQVYPRFAILDPQTTFSLPQKQVRNGIVDAFCHVMEQYAVTRSGTELQDRQGEALVLALLDVGARTLKQPTDYDARAIFMWTATQALNGLIGVGVTQDWSTHSIGHELTAFYGLDHAESLAVVMPVLFRQQKSHKGPKLAQMARRIWNVAETSDDKAADKAIDNMVAFFHSLGMPTKLADYKVSPEDAARRIGDRFAQRGTKMGEKQHLDAERIRQILRAC